MAVHSAAIRIVTCEVNPAAFAFLEENARLNRAANVVPILGDCRVVAPRGVADRVVMGHLDAIRYLDTAFGVAKDRATVHVHSVVRAGDVAGPEHAIADAAIRNGYRIASLARRTVKSYGPKVTHVVIEAAIVRSR